MTIAAPMLAMVALVVGWACWGARQERREREAIEQAIGMPFAEVVAAIGMAAAEAAALVREGFLQFGDALRSVSSVDLPRAIESPAAPAAAARPGEFDLDAAPDGCWADLWDPVEEDYRPCNATEDLDGLGLCPSHADELATIRGADQP